MQAENLNITISQGCYSNVTNHYNNIVTALYEIVYNIVTLLLQIIAMIKQPPKNIHIQKQLIVTYKQLHLLVLKHRSKHEDELLTKTFIRCFCPTR